MKKRVGKKNKKKREEKNIKEKGYNFCAIEWTEKAKGKKILSDSSGKKWNYKWKISQNEGNSGKNWIFIYGN